MRITGIEHLEHTGRTTVAELHRGSTASGETVDVALLDAAAWGAPGVAERVRKAGALQALELRRPLALESLPDGRLAVVTEHRKSVRTLLAQGARLTPNDAATITTGVARALQAVHAAGLVHGRVDFEAVRVGGGPPSWLPELAGLTEAQVPGEDPVEWAAPEVLEGRAPTPAADLYAVGRLLLALLHLDVHVDPATPPPPHATYFADFLTGCLKLDPTQRFPTVQQALKALGSINATFVGPPRVSSQEVPVVPAGVTAPAQLGPWKLEALLGEGAMGQVYKARHSLLGRAAAIKLLRPELYRSPDLVQRFFQEATTVNRVNHEHIVQITDFVQEDGPLGPAAVYCVMELLEGESLASRLSRQPLTISRALHIARQVCDALAAAHAVGVVHRDVKAENVLLCTRGGDPDYVKVLDFGVAKLLGGAGGPGKGPTMDGAIIGTPSYMAPEQASGGDVDHRIDVYAVGVMLYEMLTGKVPFEDVNFAALVVKLMSTPPPPLPVATPRGELIPASLAALVLRCLSKKPQERPATMQALREALEPAALMADVPIALNRVVPSPAPAPAAATDDDVKLAQPPSRRGLVVGLVVVAMALAAGGGWYATRPEEPVKPVVDPVVVTPPPVVDAGPALVEAAVDAGEEPEGQDAGAAVVEADVPDAGEPKQVRPPPLQKPVKLTEALVNQVLQGARKPVSKCFSKHRTSLPSPQGQVAVGWSIEVTGEVKDIVVGPPSLAGTQLEGCLTNAVKALRFPRHVGPRKKLRIPFTWDVGS